MKINQFPRFPLLIDSSPIHPLKRLSTYLNGVEIWAKREDINSGLACGGGNKLRKIEYFLPEAIAQDCASRRLSCVECLSFTQFKLIN